MKILFIDDDDSIRLIYSIDLENIFNPIEIIEREGASSAIEFLKGGTNLKIDLILCDFNMPTGNGCLVYNYLIESKSQIPFILFTTETLEDLKGKGVPLFFLRKNLDGHLIKNGDRRRFKEFLKEFFDKISLDDKEMAPIPYLYPSTKGEEDYKRIKISCFWRFNTTLCDIYLRLTETSDKFVKIIHKNETYTKQDIDKYVDKRQKYLYILSADYDAFSASLFETPFLIFNKKAFQGKEEDAVIATLAVIHDMAATVGITSTALKMADECCQEVSKLIVKENKLLDILKKMKDRKDYLYDHSLLLSCLATALALDLNWSFGETLRKISLAALLHDITIDQPELAKVRDLNDPALKAFTIQEIDQFKRHPEEAANLILKANNLPSDVADMVRSHHEKYDGTGFPKGKPMNYETITAMSALLIVAHEVVDIIYECNFDDEKERKMIQELQDRYLNGHFKKPAAALRVLHPSKRPVFGQG